MLLNVRVWQKGTAVWKNPFVGVELVVCRRVVSKGRDRPFVFLKELMVCGGELNLLASDPSTKRWDGAAECLDLER